MKWNRIVQLKTNKGSEGCFLMREMAAGLLFVFLLPYVCARLLGCAGEETDALRTAELAGSGYEAEICFDWGSWIVPMEEYLVYRLAAVLPQAYEEECRKAQAVLLRTEFMRKAGEEQSKRITAAGDGMEEWYQGTGDEAVLQSSREAVEATEGIYLCYEGEAAFAPYFPVSSGSTRTVQEVFDTEEYPYLRGIEAAQDLSAEEYQQQIVFPIEEYLERISEIAGEEQQELLRKLPRLQRDSAQYVTALIWEEADIVCEGEKARWLLGLPSSAFEMEMTQTEVIFVTSGCGHGFGMSQYAANTLALNGEDYREILDSFFEGTSLAKIITKDE